MPIVRCQRHRMGVRLELALLDDTTAALVLMEVAGFAECTVFVKRQHRDATARVVRHNNVASSLIHDQVAWAGADG